MRLFARLSLRCAALFGALLFLMVPASACRTGETETPEETGGPDAPAIQTRQGLFVSCIEEIAYRQGFISREQLAEQGNRFKSSEYGQYLLKLAQAD